METGRENQHEVQLYIENAHEMLEAAKVARSKHSGVISVFRQRFIKTNELSAGLSEIYGDLMNSRQSGDYDLNTRIEPETARQLLEKGRLFVDEVEQWLRHNRWL